MIRLSTKLPKQIKMNFKPYSPPITENLNQINTHQTPEKLNYIELTSEKIEKRKTWPKQYKLRIFNPDGSSYEIDHHEPKTVIQIPMDISKMENKLEFARQVRMDREGKTVQQFVDLTERTTKKVDGEEEKIENAEKPIKMKGRGWKTF